MKIIKGIPQKIKEDILGRITFSRRMVGRSDSVLVTDKLYITDVGYKGIVLLSDNSTNKADVCVSKTAKDSFCEGDVVFIQKSGKITFWYEINSCDNVIVATEACNHKCIMCPQPMEKDIPHRHTLNLKLISLMDKNTRRLCITGGEPSLIGEKLAELVDAVKRFTPKASLDILSNGTMFADRNVALKLALSMHEDLQIDIPLFSDIPSIHNEIVGAKTFYKTIDGIYNLALFHQQIGIRIVLHKLTYRRLPQMAEYIYRNFPFVAQVAFMGMETNASAEENIEKLWIDPYDYNKELKDAVLKLYRRGIRVLIYNAQLCVLDEEIRRFAVRSISGWKNIFLDECENCALRDRCCGLFESNRKWHSEHIHRLNEPDVEELCS